MCKVEESFVPKITPHELCTKQTTNKKVWLCSLIMKVSDVRTFCDFFSSSILIKEKSNGSIENKWKLNGSE